MKKIFLFLTLFIWSLSLLACNNITTITPTTQTTVIKPTTQQKVTTQTTKITTTKVNHMINANNIISSMNYMNTGKMGDQDGPAFAVYSNKGYNGASVDLNLKDVEIKTKLKKSLKFVNAYAFLGIDVYKNNYWANCVDVGIVWSGSTGGWHIFYNMYEPLNSSTSTWYESRKILPRGDEYKLTLSLTEDNYALLVVEGHNNGFKDEVKVEVKGAKKDGSNTSFLFNVALDYPPNTKVDREGNPCEDWKEITYANTDKGIYFKNLRAYNLTLFQGENDKFPWINDKNTAVSIWPDLKLNFDYAPTEVGLFDGTEYCINLDMNRK
jgi:hypothetical protein